MADRDTQPGGSSEDKAQYHVPSVVDDDAKAVHQGGANTTRPNTDLQMTPELAYAAAEATSETPEQSVADGGCAAYVVRPIAVQEGCSAKEGSSR